MQLLNLSETLGIIDLFAVILLFSYFVLVRESVYKVLLNLPTWSGGLLIGLAGGLLTIVFNIYDYHILIDFDPRVMPQIALLFGLLFGPVAGVVSGLSIGAYLLVNADFTMEVFIVSMIFFGLIGGLFRLRQGPIWRNIGRTLWFVAIIYCLILISLLLDPSDDYLDYGQQILAFLPSFIIRLSFFLVVIWMLLRVSNERENIHNRDLLTAELNFASRLQASLLPDQQVQAAVLPILTGSAFLPAKEVGGDWYDIIRQDNQAIFIVGDVAGKGAAASLFMANACIIFRHLAKQMRFDPAGILVKANELLTEDSDGSMFVTVICGILERDSGRLIYASAGHVPGLWRLNNGAVEDMAVADRRVLGLTADRVFHNREIILAPGDSVLFCTDGITEARNGQKQLFGRDRLREALAAGSGNPAEIVAGVIKAVQSFTAGVEQNDDIALVVFGLPADDAVREGGSRYD